MFDTPTHIVAKLAAGALVAVVPAFLSRGAVNRVCESRPSVFMTFAAFVVGILATIVWRDIVLLVRDGYMESNLGTAVILGWTFSWFGGLVLIAVSYVVRDANRKPIGSGSGVIVTLLTLLWTAPIGLVFWLVSMFYFMPRLG